MLPSCQKEESEQDSISGISPLGSSKGKPTATVGKVKDVDGNWYKTVKIGTQWWMAENLKTTRYQNHDLIGTTTPANLDICGESTPQYQWAFEGNESNVATYGRLYTWYVINDSRGLCPNGWHVSTDAEWTILIDFLDYTVAAGKLKATGTIQDGTGLWWTPNEGATNETGFTALPGGNRYCGPGFSNFSGFGFWWTSTAASPTEALFRWMGFGNSDVLFGSLYNNDGISVRCVKD